MIAIDFGRAWRPVAALALLALAGCSMFSSEDPRTAPAPLTEYAPGVSAQQAWTATVGNGGGAGFVPVVTDDAVYAATPDGSVAKFELATGRQVWRTALGLRLAAGVGSDGQTTAVATEDGHVIVLDDTGAEKWRARASSEVSIPPSVGYGIVVVRNGDYRIQAFEQDSGELRWSLQRPGPALALKTSMQILMVDGLVISGLPNGRLIAIDSASGDVQWEGAVSVSQGATDLERISDVVGTPQVQGPMLCGAAYQGQVTCFDVSQGGRPVWQQPFSSYSGLGSDTVHIYAASTRDVAQAFRLQDGEVAWKQEALRNRRLSAPAVISSALAFGDFEGYVHFLSRADGQLLGRLQTDGQSIVSPLVATSQGILVQTTGGKLFLVQAN